MSGTELTQVPFATQHAPDANPKGTMTAEELSRILARARAETASAVTSTAEEQRRREMRDAAQTADAIERRRLITEIRMMRRHRVNFAVDGLIGGVICTGATWGLYHVARWILEELRRARNTPPTANPQSDPPTADTSTGSAA